MKPRSFAVLSAPFLLLILLFMIIPVVSMLLGSFTGADGQVTLQNYIEILSKPYYAQSFLNSILISLFSSGAGLLIAVFATYAIHKKAKRGDRILVLMNLTSNFAGIALAFSFIILLGNSGLFVILLRKFGIDLTASFSLYSWWGLVLTYVYFQIPLAVMLLYPLYAAIQQSWSESARLLGATNTRFWLKIGLPILLPGIMGTLSILFANAMGAYATAYALVSSNYNLVPIRIGSLISGDIYARPELGSVLGVLLGLTLLVAMFINRFMLKLMRKDVQNV